MHYSVFIKKKNANTNLKLFYKLKVERIKFKKKKRKLVQSYKIYLYNLMET